MARWPGGLVQTFQLCSETGVQKLGIMGINYIGQITHFSLDSLGLKISLYWTV